MPELQHRPGRQAELIHDANVTTWTTSSPSPEGLFGQIGSTTPGCAMRRHVYRAEVRDHRRRAVVAVRRSWGQPDTGGAGEGVLLDPAPYPAHGVEWGVLVAALAEGGKRP
jgi:hypothetical protein